MRWCERGGVGHRRGLMFFCEAIDLINLGLFSWSRTCVGPLLLASAYETTSAHLCHSRWTEAHPPFLVASSPRFSSHLPSPFFSPFQMQNKQRASLLQHFQAHQSRVEALRGAKQTLEHARARLFQVSGSAFDVVSIKHIILLNSLFSLCPVF